MNCPTCNLSFPREEIAEHADNCAEAAEGIPQSLQAYGNLLMHFQHDQLENNGLENEDAQVFSVPECSSNNNNALAECLMSLQCKLKEEKSTIYVRCRRLWDAYIHVSKQCKWFNPENSIKVTFVGEQAVDGGFEFFTGKNSRDS